MLEENQNSLVGSLGSGEEIQEIKSFVQKLREIRDKKEKLSAELKKLNEEDKHVQQFIINKMRSEGVEFLKVHGYGTASVKEIKYPKVLNFEKLWIWIFRNKRFELLYREIKSKAWREAVEKGEDIPEIEAYSEDHLTFTKYK